ncbi:hypothetical protein B0H12DRAFT_1245483 [Mycena haematopus]|nr:hypothetical protein B0H12DRAFT_1245483 [Mycena haematopus]
MPHTHNSARKENDERLAWSVDLPKRRPGIPSTNFDPRRAPVTMPWPNLPRPDNFPSDWWHTDIGIKIINGAGDLWSGDRIPFISDHGIGAPGVSMEQARLGIGMRHGRTSLSDLVHPMLFHIPHPMLSIRCPGYQSIQESFCEHDGLRPLNIKRFLYLDENCTLAQLAQQVAEHFFEFSEAYGEHCNIYDPKAVLLGPGIFWNAEIAIVDDYMLINYGELI